MKVAVLGLGEAGAIIAADLVRAGDEVGGYDPGPVGTPSGVERHSSPQAAVEGCQLVMAVTPASATRKLLEDAVEGLDNDAVYADLSTSAPGLKMELEALLAGRGPLYADVALMASVPGRGLGTSSLTSGPGAHLYADLVNSRGGSVEVVGDRAGEAAARKLLRSVVMKGLAAVLMEAMEAAQEAGNGDWMWDHIVDSLTAVDEPMLRRLVKETPRHARRRLDEMEAARQLLEELGVPVPVINATISRLSRLVAEGVPEITLD